MTQGERIEDSYTELFPKDFGERLERLRSRRRAMNRIAELVRELAPIRQLHVSYSTGRHDATAIRDELADLVEPEHLVESRFGLVLGTHLGPNTIGVGGTQRSGGDE